MLLCARIAEQDADTSRRAITRRNADICLKIQPPQPIGKTVLVQANQNRRRAVRQVLVRPRPQALAVGGCGGRGPVGEPDPPHRWHKRPRTSPLGREQLLQSDGSSPGYPGIPQEHQICLWCPGRPLLAEQRLGGADGFLANA
jgi:hypothetical protein